PTPILVSYLRCLVDSFRNSFFFTAPPTTETYTLSLHDALPIYRSLPLAKDGQIQGKIAERDRADGRAHGHERIRAVKRGQREKSDRKSTRLNSSHVAISYAVFCLKKKKPAMSA